MRTKFLLECLKDGDHSEDLGIEGRILDLLDIGCGLD